MNQHASFEGKKKFLYAPAAILQILFFTFCSLSATSQMGPGYIIRQADNTTNLGASGTNAFTMVASGNTITGRNILNPDFTAGATPNNFATASPFTGIWSASDDVTGSELPYAAIPPYSLEPFSDLRRGPNRLFSDFVPSGRASDFGASYYMYFRNVANSQALCFRLRMGSIMPGAKGYAILIDVDGKFGATGPNADPTYRAATTGTNGNPGFELEIDLYTQSSGQTGVAIYNIDNTDNPSTSSASWSATDYTRYSQVAIAGTNDNGDPDFSLDFFVPWERVVAAYPGLTTGTTLRFVPTTVMAPQPAIGGPKSDIYGLDDNNFPNTNSEYELLLSASPGFTISQLENTGVGSIPGTGNANLCTAAPAIVSASTSSVTFSWTPLPISTQSTTTINLYRASDNSLITSFTGITAGTSITRSVNLSGISQVYAKAVSTNENSCLSSNTITVNTTSCTNWQAQNLVAPNLICSNLNNLSKGVAGNNRNNASWVVYTHNTTSGVTQNSTTDVGGSTFELSFTGSGPADWRYSSGCSGGQNMNTGAYNFWYQDANGCRSDVATACFQGTNNKLAGALPAPTIVSPSSGQLTEGAASITINSYNGTTAVLYVNGSAVSTQTVGGSGATFNYNGTSGTTSDVTFNFSNLGILLQRGDVVSVLISRQTGTNSSSWCGSKTSSINVSCYVPRPAFNTNSSGTLTRGSFISGTSQVRSGAVVIRSGGTIIANCPINTNGSWTTQSSAGYTVSFPTGWNGQVQANTTYTAEVVDGGCTSSTSSAAAGFALTSAARCGTLAPAAIENTTTSVTVSLSGTAQTGTVVTILQDGFAVGSATTGSSTNTVVVPVSNLYSGGKLQVMVQDPPTSSMEAIVCNDVYTVGCTSTTPTYAYVSCTECTANDPNTLKPGGTLTYQVTNAVTNQAYVLKNTSTGQTASDAVYAVSDGDLAITSYPVSAAETKQSVQVVGTAISSTSVCTKFSTLVSDYQVLPVKLVYFTGRRGNDQNLLSWQTALEERASHFELERSTNGVNYVRIGRIATRGAGTNYTFQDKDLQPVSYYRLRMVDQDGRFAYSNIVLLQANGTSIELGLAQPNPFNAEITVSLNQPKAQPVQMLLLDAAGRVVRRTQIAAPGGSSRITLSGLGAIPEGVYLLKVLVGDMRFHQQVVKTGR